MTIIALDSSGTTATVAIARDGRLLAEYTVDNGMTHSQTMLPMLDAITRQLDLKMEEVDAVAVAGGPGSFTGLRIGAAVVNTLAHELNIPLFDHHGKKHKIILPDYGRGANISKPRK